MKNSLRFGIIFIMCLVFAGTGYCQSTCPLNKITPESRFASQLMFYMGNIMLLAICAGIGIAIFLFLPKRIKTCPVSKLAQGRKIVLWYDEKRIVIAAGSDAFQTIISNFSDERKQPDTQIAGFKMYIYVKSSRYTIEVSIAGWNFLNEERNSRRLLNNLEVMKIIDSFIDKSGAPMV